MSCWKNPVRRGILLYLFTLYILPIVAAKPLYDPVEIKPITFTEATILRLNDAYRVRRISGGTVFLQPKVAGSALQVYTFKSVQAEIVFAAFHRKNVKNTLVTLEKKYGMNKAESRRQLKQSLNVLIGWELIYLSDIR